MKLKRVQLMLEDDQHAQLKALAHRKGTSLSDLVRRMVDKGLDEERGPPKGILELIGTVSDGTTSARDVDKYLYTEDWR